MSDSFYNKLSWQPLTLESGLGESHLSKYLCPTDYGPFDHHGFLGEHGDRTFQHHDDGYHQDDGGSGVCYSFDPGEKKPPIGLRSEPLVEVPWVSTHTWRGNWVS